MKNLRVLSILWGETRTGTEWRRVEQGVLGATREMELSSTLWLGKLFSGVHFFQNKNHLGHSLDKRTHRPLPWNLVNVGWGLGI